MKNVIILLCLLALGCGTPATTSKLPAPANNKWSDARLVRVLEAQDHRDGKSLLALLKDTSVAVRRAAAMAFVSVQDTSARAGLIAAMHDVQPAVRLAAAWALSYVADTNAVKAIADQALEETDPGMAHSRRGSTQHIIYRNPRITDARLAKPLRQEQAAAEQGNA